MKAIIMAGGKGTRLAEIAKDIPKPMVQIGGKPILTHQIEALRDAGIVDIVIVIGFLGEVIQNHYGNGDSLGVQIQYLKEEEPLGTAGSLFYLKNQVPEPALLLFGDIFFDIDIKRFVNFHLEKKSELTLLTHPNSHPYDSDLIVCDKKARVIHWDSKHNVRDYYYKNCVNAGLYMITEKIFDYIRSPIRMDFEKDIVVPMINGGRHIYGYETSEYVKDAGTVDRYHHVNDDYEKGIPQSKNLKNRQRCIFLDRDGTINEHNGFIRSADEFRLYDGIIGEIQQINRSGYLAVVITNQPVIARGECSIEELETIHKKLETLLGDGGAYLDGIFYCPHHPDKGFTGERPEYKFDCDCRKPKTGLIKKAVEKFNIDLEQSYFVGDTTMDMQTAHNAGLSSVLVQTGEAGLDKKYDNTAGYVCKNLQDAVQYILNKR